MGCCFSRPAGPNAPYPGSTTSPSARAINSQPPLQAGAQTDDSSAVSGGGSHSSPTGQRSRRRRQHDQQPLSQHIDKPLRLHKWTTIERPWTRTALDTERTEFFDTRVTGRAEVWQVLKVALEVLWEADRARRRLDKARPQSSRPRNGEEVVALVSEAQPDPSLGEGDAPTMTSTGPKAAQDEAMAEALATAQGILRAAEVTLPTGDLVNGVYDSLGNYYPLPEHIVCDPNNMAEDSGSADAAVKADKEGDHGEEQGGSDLDDDEAERRREEKGKGVAVVKDLVPVRARLSETGRDLIVRIGLTESVRSLARKITEASNLPSNRRIRVAYMGKILSENTTLEEQGWQKGHIVNAFVFNR